MISDAVGGILLASVTLYAVLGGADFGGGLWDLLAGGDRRGREPRRLIEESITPVWEANHVWLVFDLVIFWTAFPHAFAAVMTTAALPLWLALAGIVLRGAGFAFRKEAQGLRMQRALGAAFAFSSLLTPFFMGTVIGAIATGQVPADASHASLPAWTSVTSLLTGFMFVGACGYLAAVYLVGEAARRGDHRLRAYFTRRAQAAGIVAGALSLAVLAELTAGRPRGVRVLAAAGVAAVIWGWGVAQYPVLLPGTNVTLSNAGAPPATLVAIVVLFVVAVVIVGPSFGLLFSLQGRRLLHSNDDSGAALALQPLPSAEPLVQQPRPTEASPAVRIAVFAFVVVDALLRARRRAR